MRVMANERHPRAGAVGEKDPKVDRKKKWADYQQYVDRQNELQKAQEEQARLRKEQQHRAGAASDTSGSAGWIAKSVKRKDDV